MPVCKRDQLLALQLLFPCLQQIPLEVEQASAHCGGGFPQVVLSDQGQTSGQVEMIAPGDRHDGVAAAVSLIGTHPPSGGCAFLPFS